MPLPGLPHPADMIERAQQIDWPTPEDEHAWRPLPPDAAPRYAPLAERADAVLQAVELRARPTDAADPSLPDDVRQALEALGYLH